MLAVVCLLGPDDVDLGAPVELEQNLLDQVSVLGFLVVGFNIAVNELVSLQGCIGRVIDEDLQ
jgi:hypothetical protein